MKSKKTLLIISVVLISSIVGCSSFVESTRKSLLGETSPRKAKTEEPKWVSKSQYDELMEKYKTLNIKYESLKDGQPSDRPSYDQLNSLVEGTTETIDVFENENTTPSSLSDSTINSDVDYYNKAVSLYENKKIDEALKIFQFLEKSKVKQIQVHAKKYIGEVYLQKKQFDLALQVFEGIINQHSFSGVVLVALKNASYCSGKLGLVDKQIKYDSLLKDVFEVRV